MIISNSHKFIFIHILKTAGTTITLALDSFLRWNDIALGGTSFGEKLNVLYKERFGLLKHSTALQIKGVVGEAVWSSYFSFTFVRHPYTRMVSFYIWLEQSIARASSDAALWSWPTTQAFLESRSFSDFIRNEKFLRSMAARPQIEWLEDSEGRRIVDFVGRFENLEEGCRIIEERVGLRLESIGHHNPSDGRRHPADILSAEADYAHLHDIQRRDFECLGYDSEFRFCPRS
jgi:hypothetical protein